MENQTVSWRIPFNKPGLTGNELRYIAEAITRGQSSATALSRANVRRSCSRFWGLGRFC